VTVRLARRALAELLGTGLLVAAVVGSGIMASRLTPHDVGLQLLENSTATALVLGALILMFGAVSGTQDAMTIDYTPGAPSPTRAPSNR
jgi:glycerol uptake facilitator-like aquaporin